MQPWLSIILIFAGLAAFRKIRNRYGGLISGALLCLSLNLYGAKYALYYYALSSYTEDIVKTISYGYLNEKFNLRQNDLQINKVSYRASEIKGIGPCEIILRKNHYYEINGFRNEVNICRNGDRGYYAIASLITQIKILDRPSLYLFGGYATWAPRAVPIGTYAIDLRSDHGLR